MHLAGLVIFPAFFNVWISLHRVGLDDLNDVFHAPFAGLENYFRAARDYAFLMLCKRRVVYSFTCDDLTVLLGLGAAMLLNRNFRGRGLVRADLPDPYIAPLISVAYIWKWLLDPTVRGVVNWSLIKLGVMDEPVAWLGKQGLALLS